MNAQVFSGEKQEIYKVIVQLFDGMREADSSKVHLVFREDCRMYTNYVDHEGQLMTKEGSLKNFLNAIGSPRDEIWDEKIWNTKIDYELGVAQVWTEYAFFRGDQFSHCGIDAFQLVKEKSWKIIQIIDTRRVENCTLPEKMN